MKTIRVGMTWEEAGMTSPPEPGAHILHCGHCGLCGIEVHRIVPRDLETAARSLVGDGVRPFPELISHLSNCVLRVEAAEIERACVYHLTAEHPRRYRLWKRLGWRWLVGGLAP